jgi:flagellar basal-body rod protein FlgC
MFHSLGISGSGMRVHRTWMDAISDNIANVNTVRSTDEEPFRARYVVATPLENGSTGAGVAVGGVELSKGTPKLIFDPSHPLADEDGMVQLADVDLGEQLTSIIMAQRGYQANISAMDRARAAYQAAIQMGRG